MCVAKKKSRSRFLDAMLMPHRLINLRITLSTGPLGNPSPFAQQLPHTNKTFCKIDTVKVSHLLVWCIKNVPYPKVSELKVPHLYCPCLLASSSQFAGKHTNAIPPRNGFNVHHIISSIRNPLSHGAAGIRSKLPDNGAIPSVVGDIHGLLATWTLASEVYTEDRAMAS